MKKLVKIVCLLVVMSMLAGLVVACGGTTGKADTSTVSTTAAGSTDTANKLDKVELKILTGGDQPDQPDAPAVADEIAKVTADNINVHITVQTYAWGDYIQKVKTMAAAGEPFDIYLNFSGEMQNAINSKQCIELDDLVNKYGPDLKKQIPDSLWGDVTVSGKLYGIPANYPFVGDKAVLIRGDLREKYGVPPIKTLADYEAYLTAIAKNEPGMVGISTRDGKGGPCSLQPGAAIAPEVQNMFSALNNDYGWLAMVADTTKKPYKVENAYKNESMKKLMLWNRKAYAAGWIDKSILTAKDPNTLFSSGKSATLPNDVWTLKSLAPTMEKNIPGCKIEAVTFFNYDNAIRFDKDNNFAQISSTSKNPERAVMFMNWMSASQDNYDLYMYGINGKHYVPVGDKQYKLPDGVDPAKLAYSPTPWWGRRMNMDRMDVNSSPAFLQIFNAAVNCKYTTPNLIKFNYDSSKMKTEIAQIQTAQIQFMQPVWWGIKNTDADYQAALDALDKAGLDKVIADIQEQLDAWAATNDK